MSEKKTNILIVDDRPENLVALESVLVSLNQNLVRALSGEEVLRFLLDNDAAVILLDVQMPGLDGFETAQLIRSRESSRHTPIIFITALDTTDTQIFRGYFLGAVDYLVKPFAPEILKAKVKAFVNLHKQAQELAEKKRAEEEQAQRLIREQQARLLVEENSRLKDEFLAVISHELRTPLTAMLGWTRLLRSGNLDEHTSTRALEIIERNISAQARLIDDLLDVSRIITGKLNLNIRTIELLPVIEIAMDSVRNIANAKSINLVLQIENHDSGEYLVDGDLNRLQQVFINLLSNAVKFTPQDGRIEVRLEMLEGQVIIKISDSGKGISPTFLPYVFDRFRQASLATAKEHGGLGLGLAIVRHLVERHGGTVKAESPGEGKGSTFTVTLPKKMVTVSQIETTEPITTQLALNGVRLLVVDDHEDVRFLLSTILRQYGAEVTGAESVAKALEIFGIWRPNIIISDIGMPEADGYELISKIRSLSEEEGGQIPAIALTAFTKEEDRQQIISAGFQSHVPKPVEPTELVTIINSLVGNRAQVG